MYTQKRLLAFLIPALMVQSVWADTDTKNTEEVQDLGTLYATIDKGQSVKLGEEVVTHSELSEQLVQNSHDLVRYNNEVDVAEVGRYGNKGFAIRGVDGNRVAMSIDGVGLPEAEANEIFSPYGYMYEGRFNPDVEMMSMVRISAGADSLKSGSGAVGGAVNYSTKKPVQFIRGDKSWGGYAKTGYSTKNDELLTAVGVGAELGKAEVLLNYVHRQGHETKNHALRKADKARLLPTFVYSKEEVPVEHSTTSLIYPDPLEFKRDSVLAKAFYNITDEHKVGISGFYQEQKNHMNTDSKNATTGSRLGTTIRRANDVEKMQSVGLTYDYTPDESTWLDKADVGLTYNDVLGLADTWIYGRNFDYDQDWNVSGIKSAQLSNREYRPTKTKTHQLSLNAKFKPFDFDTLGMHTFTTKANYIKQDYTSSAFNIDSPSIPNHLSYAFPDAKKSIYNLSIIDDIGINDNLKANIGVRYDGFEYKPYYEDNANPLLSETQRNYEICIKNDVQGAFCDAYRSGGLKNTKFSSPTWSAMVEYDIIPKKLKASYKIGTGFLAPTVTQIYSSFSFNGATQIPNYNLKPETSLNQEFELEYTPTSNIALNGSLYLSKYKDFIHTRYWDYDPTSPTNGECVRGTCLQSLNLDTAQVNGVKLGVMANLSPYLKTKGQVNVFANYHASKDKAIIQSDNNGKLTINTMASVPNSLLIGGGYVSPNDDWAINGRINVIGRKKPQDSKKLETVITRKKEYLPTPNEICVAEAKHYGTSDESCYYQMVSSYEEVVRPYKYIDQSKSVVVYDIYGTKKFGKDKNWILNAGVYNISNETYIPWETLRQFAVASINGMVDKDGYGFNRYTATGRNYAVSLTYEF